MRRFGRKSPADLKRAYNAAERFYALAGDREVVNQRPVRERRSVDIDAVHRKQEENPDLEKHVLSEVGDYLTVHPSVLLLIRQNSGSMPYQTASGRMAPVWFYKILKSHEKVTIVDLWGFLKDGRPFAFECKRRDWKGVHEPRELKQQAYMQMIECIGGVTGFVRGLDEIQSLLPSG